MPNPAPAAAVADSPVDVLPLEYGGPDGRRPTTSRFRWVILFLAFLGTTINYVDRSVWNIIGPFLMDNFAITKPQWGILGSAFAWSYAFGQLMAGGILDRVGVRIGYPVGLALWSLVAIMHAAAVGMGGAVASALGLSVSAAVVGFIIVRCLLGITESPNYPAVTKTLSEWFPKKERAFAMGWVNAGGNVGILIALLMVEPISSRWGWQWAFITTGSLGIVWLALWIPLYRRPERHPRVSAAELALIRSDPPEPTTKIRWRTLLAYRQTWAFALAKFITDATWWFYMVWFAKFLKDKYGLNLEKIGLPLMVVYLMADIGSVAGGWLSSSMIRRGASVNRARKTALLISAMVVVPIIFGEYPTNAWVSVILLGMATAGHQGFSSNLYTLVSDTFPRRAVAGVAGLGGFFGYVGAALWSSATGFILEATGNKYVIVFSVAGLGYLVAFGIIHVLMPRLEPALIDEPAGHGLPGRPA
jgi:ACS family hexuronate transporter-like MFS transporter